MKTCCLLLFALPAAAQQADSVPDRTEDRRVVQTKGYHIVANPARMGETPPEAKQERADSDRRRHSDITDQTVPTREPELKPKDIKP